MSRRETGPLAGPAHLLTSPLLCRREQASKPARRGPVKAAFKRREPTAEASPAAPPARRSSAGAAADAPSLAPWAGRSIHDSGDWRIRAGDNAPLGQRGERPAEYAARILTTMPHHDVLVLLPDTDYSTALRFFHWRCWLLLSVPAHDIRKSAV